MSVDYRHNFIELYSISGGSAIGDPDLRGIHLNGERPLDARTTRDFTLYVFDPNGNVISTTRYDLYLGVQAGNLNDSDRLASTLNSLPVGTPFGIVTWDEPSQGHYQNWAGVDYNPLIDAMVRAGADRSLYARPWRQWCAYMLVGKIGEPAYFEKLDETPRPDTAPVYGNGFIHCKFSIVDNKFQSEKYQTPISAKNGGNWKELQRMAVKAGGNWHAVRKIFQKNNGVWEKKYILNAHYANALGMAQKVTLFEYAGLFTNMQSPGGVARTYLIYQFSRDGEVTSVNSYDLLTDVQVGNLIHTTRMINALNAMPIGQIYCVCSFDEPMNGHLNPDLLTAMYRVGATEAIYGQPMAYRGAYLLIGKVGEPSSFEKYQGEVVGPQYGNDGGDPNAYIDRTFAVANNNIFLMGPNWGWGSAVILPW